MAEEPVDHVVFDTSFLAIKRTFSGSTTLEFSLAKRSEPYGSALTIQLPEALDKEETTEVSVEYETTEQCTAIQWLNPEQTVGRKLPFL